MFCETHSFSRIPDSSNPFMARFPLQLADHMETQTQLIQSDPPLVVWHRLNTAAKAVVQYIISQNKE
jgi:hypothetical protein